MHARHRSPGNGYKSSSMGIGLAVSRISPEGSIKGHGPFSSDYRNFNRGLGRGQSKSYHPLQPPRRGDVFMEAGQLAAEYLVSQGLLSASALSVKSQNGTSKKHVGDFQDFRPQDGDSLPAPQEGRTSALARLGNVVNDVGSGRRRFPDEYNSMGSRNHMKGKRRLGSFRSYNSNWGRENGRTDSWVDNARASPDLEGEDDSPSVYHEEQQQVDKDGDWLPKSCTTESVPKSDDAADSERELEKFQFSNDIGSRASSGAGKDLALVTGINITRMADDFEALNAGDRRMKESSSYEEGKQDAADDFPVPPCPAENDKMNKKGSDLLTLCRFAKVPTKTRSSLKYKGLRVNTVSLPKDESTSNITLPKGSGVSVKEDCIGGFSSDGFAYNAQSSKCLDSDISRSMSLQSIEDFGELGTSNSAEQEKCSRSQSLSDEAFISEQEASQEPPGFGRCTFVVKERGEKRAAQHNDARAETKKPREWISSVVTQANQYFNLSNSRENEPSSQEQRASPREEAIVAVDENSSMDISLFPKGDNEPCIGYAEEKQLFPSSFKICDLNLMESSDINENHDSDPILIYPVISETKKEAAPVDIDLSISHNCNISDEFGRHAADDQEIEVIDLESDSVQEDKAFNNVDRKTEAAFASLEEFPSNVQDASEIPDVQDGYGLMISELLEPDITNCSSVQADINSLHNEMNLHNGEAILAEDDPIYMSLGEIPISFLRVWEHPTPEYEKPF